MEVLRNTKKSLAKTLRGRKDSPVEVEEDWSGGGGGWETVAAEAPILAAADIPLELPDEEVAHVFNGIAWAYDSHIPDAMRFGTLFTTTARAGFVAAEESGFSFPLQMIGSITRQAKRAGEFSTLTLVLKDFRSFRLSVPRQWANMHEILSQAAFVDSHEQFFAFVRQRQPVSAALDGWQVFSAEKEWERQMQRSGKGGSWQACTNGDYSLCNTYPKLLMVPSGMSKDTIVAASSFRSRGRFPTLSYIHTNGRVITRASQPLVGIKGHRSTADEELVEAIRVSASPSDVLHIIDARPKVNAVANQAMGKGFESEKLYRGTRIKFANIANIHVMRDSRKDLAEVGTCKDSAIAKTVANSSWLEHIRRILCSGIAIASYVHVDSAPCLVHW